jgi:hypothetical protein
MFDATATPDMPHRDTDDDKPDPSESRLETAFMIST